MIMRGSKEDEKVINPMFPRLHVNDTEKGGPRAPPRNKMALYEQFSVPSHRFSSGSASALPIPPNNGSNLVPSMSSSHGGGYGRSVFTPLCDSPVTSHTGGGGKLSIALENEEQKSTNSTNDQSLSTTQPLLSSAECNSFGSHRFSNYKNFSWKKLGDENDFTVPISEQSREALNRSNGQRSKEHEMRSSLNLSIFQNASKSIDPKVREQKMSQTEEKDKVSQTSLHPRKVSTSVPSIKDKTPTAVISSPPGIFKGSESLKRPHPSSNQECRSNSADPVEKLHDTDSRLNQNIGTAQEKPVQKDTRIFTESAGVLVKETRLRSESHLKPSLKDHNRNPNLENSSEFHGDKKGRLLVGAVASVERDAASETSMVDSESTLVISPDDVVGVLGEKQFLKARRAFVNQQRLFAMQLFELHRLIKVQKLIAEQPDLLLEDSLFVGKASFKLSSVKMLPCKRAIQQPPLAVRSNNDSQKPPAFVEIADENAAEKLPLPSVNNETIKGLVTQRSNYGSYSVSATPAAMPNNTRSSPWGFPPPGNQWLVTVMSPSEGLIYKPYTGPCPPTAGFIAPMYGSCGPVSLTPTGGGEYMNAACGFPASHQQGIGIIPGAPPMAHTYFPPYGMPVMNTSMLGSDVEQMSPFTGNQSREHQFSVGDVNFTSPHQCSCNMSSQMSRVFSYCVGKYPASKDSELQGSTASNPCERRVKGDALPLFPTEPTAQASDDQTAQSKEQPTRVIKVVPHNPRLATESAARIFQSIQEERKFYD